jgi:hypothetical protein
MGSALSLLGIHSNSISSVAFLSCNAVSPAFRFLTPGGEGRDYYQPRLAALRVGQRIPLIWLC